MAKETVLWECEVCGTLFTEKDDASNCEKDHAALESLKIVSASYDPNKDGDNFPHKILVEDEDYSGNLAEYRIRRVSSCESFDEELN